MLKSVKILWRYGFYCYIGVMITDNTIVGITTKLIINHLNIKLMIVLLNANAGTKLNVPTSKQEITFDYVNKHAKVEVPPSYALVAILSYTTIQDLSQTNKAAGIKSLSTPIFVKAGYLSDDSPYRNLYHANNVLIIPTGDIMQGIHANINSNELSMSNVCRFIKADKELGLLTAKTNYGKASRDDARFAIKEAAEAGKLTINAPVSLLTANATSVYTVDYKIIPIADIKGYYLDGPALPELVDKSDIAGYTEPIEDDVDATYKAING